MSDATQRFNDLVDGTQTRENNLRAAQDTIVYSAGQEDTESVDQGRLQGALFQIFGKHNLDKLRRHLVDEARWDCLTRLKELRDPDTLHEWLTCISPKCGATLNSTEFVEALRLRVGAIFSEEGVDCRKCGNPTDNRLYHAQCCDRINATKGHYKVRDCVHALSSIRDSSAQPDAIGLAPSFPKLRPADILCSGPTGLVALDINVSSPFSQNAGGDSCDASFRRKQHDYACIILELSDRGI